MKWDGTHIGSYVACGVVALFVAVVALPPASHAAASEEHSVGAAFGAKPLPVPAHHVRLEARKDSRRSHTFSEGILSFTRRSPEWHAQFCDPAPSMTPLTFDVFVRYLPRDPPTA